VAKETARFAVELDVTDVEDGAASAAAALAKLRAKIEDETKALRDMQAAMGRLKGSSNEVIAAKKDLQTKITASKESIAQAQASYLKGGGALDQIGKKSLDAAKGAKANAGAQVELGKATGAAGAQSAAAAGSAGRLAGALGRIGPIAAAIAAVLILTVGLIVAAVKMADLARSARLANEAMAGSAEGGAKLGGRIDKLSKSLPMTKAALTDIAKALTDKGLQGASLEYALSAVARTTAVLGATAGGKIQAVAEEAKRLKRFTAQALDFTGTGITIDDVAASLAKRTKTTLANAKASIKAGAVDLASGLEALDNATKTKLGGAAAKMNNSLGSIWERAEAGFGSMFAGLDLEPWLQGLSDIVGLLDSSSESGKALRAIAEIALQPLLDFLGPGAGVVSFLEDLVIGTLLVAIGMIRAKNAVVAFAVGAGAAIKGVATGVSDLGSAIIDGLVAGIAAGAAKVAKALTGVVDGAIESAKEQLGIESPSKVFAEMGRQTMAGYEQGVESSAPGAAVAVRSAMTTAADAGAASAGSPGTGGTTLVANVTINGSGDDPAFLSRVHAAVVQALRDAATMVGEPVRGAA